jgi:predicted NUDIX family NTP pyrophosphohydrolase
MATTEEKVGLYIDGQTIIKWNQTPRTGKVHLTQGSHTFQLDFEKILGPTLTLSWKKPGDSTMSPVPNTALGVPHAGSKSQE